MIETRKLINGVQMPKIAFGTWRLDDTDKTVDIIKRAVSCGYRHIDTAAKYGNEASVGKAVRECGIPREELFVTNKLRNTERGYETTRKDFYRALEVMGLDYLDLYLIHWPAPADFYPDWKEINAETWRALEELYQAGKVRAIGVSNFWEPHLEALKETCRVFPMVNQLKVHPGMIQKDLVAYCQKNQMVIEAYSPLGAGALLKDKTLEKIAEKYGKSSAQICLRWCMEHDAVPLPKSSSELRMRQNLNIFDFAVSEEDMEILDKLPAGREEERNPDKVNLD